MYLKCKHFTVLNTYRVHTWFYNECIVSNGKEREKISPPIHFFLLLLKRQIEGEKLVEKKGKESRKVE